MRYLRALAQPGAPAALCATEVDGDHNFPLKQPDKLSQVLDP